MASPDVAVLGVGETLRLAPEFQDSAGQGITATRPVFRSADATIAEVGANGRVIARAAGETVVRASMDGIELDTHIRVVPATLGGTVVDVFPADEHQVIRGWEGTGQLGELDCDSAVFRRVVGTLVDRLVNELGITRIRLGVRSGIEHPDDYFAEYRAGRLSYPLWRRTWFAAVNDNDDPRVGDPTRFQWDNFDRVVEGSVLPMRKALASRGDRLTVSLNFVDFWQGAGSKAFPHMKHPEEYAELIRAVFDHMQGRYGFTPDAVELVLEPENTPYNGTDIGRSLVAVERRLREGGYAPDFIGPSTTKAANAPGHYDEIVAVPGAKGLLDEISYHKYGGVSDAVLRAILLRARRDGLATGMLEHIGSGFDGLHEDLTVADASAWEQFALSYCGRRDNPENAGVYYQVNHSDPANPRINITNEAKLLRQVFHYVRPGAVRIGAVATRREVKPLAFRNPSGRFVIVVRTSGPETFTVRGLPAGRYAVNYSTRQGRYDVDLPEVIVRTRVPAKLQIPANGAITLFQQP